MDNVRPFKGPYKHRNMWHKVPWYKVTDKSDKCTAINVTLDQELLKELGTMANAALQHERKTDVTFPNLRLANTQNFYDRVSSWFHAMMNHNAPMYIERKYKKKSRMQTLSTYVAIAAAASVAIAIARIIVTHVRA